MPSNKIEINEQFALALSLLENGGRNIFITGKAGTGKSTLLKHFMENTGRSVVVLAPTGVSAINIGGQTIHSFFGFRPDITVEKARSIAKGRVKRETVGVFKKIDTLVIDEISMVRADIFDCMDAFLRIARGEKDVPFGGVVLAMFGDLYQLPPVVTSHEREIFSSHYKSPYFFDSRVFPSLDISLIELEKIYRQTDERFVQILNAIRNNSISDEGIAFLNERLSRDTKEGEGFIHITSLNKEAKRINDERLGALPDRPRIYHAEINGEFDEKSYPASRELTLKKGAQVMMLNNDLMGRWVNGTVATVTDLDDDSATVKLCDGREETVLPYEWRMFKFRLGTDGKKIMSESVGNFTQLPMTLAWAVTIHKSQGKTFDTAVIDIGRVFECGQTYVALSRLRSIEGLFLKSPLKKGHVRVDYRIVKFLTSLQYGASEKTMPTGDKISFIQAAIGKKIPLKIVYLKSDDTKSRRTVLPTYVGEMEYLGRTFLGMRATCDLRCEERTFRVDRIIEMNTP